MSNFTSTNDTAVPTVDLSRLPVFISAVVAARLGVPAPAHTTEGRTDAYSGPFGDDVAHVVFDYSDGYGGTYGVGE